jgi:hypothetical protein
MLAIVRRQSTSEEQAGWEGGMGKFFKNYLSLATATHTKTRKIENSLSRT